MQDSNKFKIVDKGIDFFLSFVVFCSAILILCHVFAVNLFIEIFGSYAPNQLNSTLAILLVTCSIILNRYPFFQSGSTHTIYLILNLLSLCIGGEAFIENFFNFNFSINQFLLNLFNLDTLFIPRMTIPTAILIIFTSLFNISYERFRCNNREELGLCLYFCTSFSSISLSFSILTMISFFFKFDVGFGIDRGAGSGFFEILSLLFISLTQSRSCYHAWIGKLPEHGKQSYLAFNSVFLLFSALWTLNGFQLETQMHKSHNALIYKDFFILRSTINHLVNDIEFYKKNHIVDQTQILENLQTHYGNWFKKITSITSKEKSENSLGWKIGRHQQDGLRVSISVNQLKIYFDLETFFKKIFETADMFVEISVVSDKEGRILDDPLDILKLNNDQKSRVNKNLMISKNESVFGHKINFNFYPSKSQMRTKMSKIFLILVILSGVVSLLIFYICKLLKKKNKIEIVLLAQTQELEKNRNAIEMAMKSAQMGIWDWDIDTGRIHWTDSMYEIFGFDSKKRPTLSSWGGLVNPDDFLLWSSFWDESSSYDKKIINKKIRFLVSGSNNSSKQKVILIMCQRVSYCEIKTKKTKDMLVGLVMDISDQTYQEMKLREKEMQVLHATRLSAVGEMAAGMAHEINNPLAIIQGKASQIKMKIEMDRFDPIKAKVDLEKIETTCQRISRIIRGLKSFSRGADYDPVENTNLKEVIDEIIEMNVERFKMHGIEIRFEKLEVTYIDCRTVQIGQVLTNLFNNALDAIRGQSSPWVEIAVLEKGPNVQIHVTDSGLGIPLHLRDKIMLPFFTTKSTGMGTGLGLSISKGIIEEHHGQFFIDTNCPNTRFVIEIPIRQNTKEKKAA